MTFFGMSATVLYAGAAALAAGLLLLHLLRVRLRTVPVDTLLFFRLAGALQKPRVLPGKPARWLALALASALVAAAWLALAEPRSGLEAPSRFLVVEPDLVDSDARLAKAAALLGSGLGPRGAVIAATTPPVVLLAGHEPAALLRARGAALRTLASPQGEAQALRALSGRRSAGDEVVWLGARAPAVADPVVHVPPASGPVAALRGLSWQRQAGGAFLLVLRCEGGGMSATLRHGEQTLASGSVLPGCRELRLGPCLVPAGAETLRCAIAGADQDLIVPVPTAAPLSVFVDPGVPAACAAALTAVLAADAELASAAAAAAADVIVATDDPIDPALGRPVDPRPRLVLAPGEGSGLRFAVAATGCPVPLSLRDQRRRAAPALPPLADAAVWIEDAAQGGALAAARGGAAGIGSRVWLVDWLLQPVSHADVPVLLAAALRALGGRPEVQVLVAGQPAALPAAFPVPARPGAHLPAEGAVPFARARPGQHHLTDRAPVHVVAAQCGQASLPLPAVTLAACGGAGAWAPWLLGVLVVLLALDALWFHRGRLP